MSSNTVHKVLYKLELGVLKVIPMLLAGINLLNSVLSYFDIDLLILSYIGGSSILTLGFIYLSSYVFKFCEYHRMFLHYTVVTWVLNIYDCHIGIPITDKEYLIIQLAIVGIFLFIILYLYRNKRLCYK